MEKIRETSDIVCQKLISKLPITDGCKILEPSVGDGKILTYLFDNYFLNNTEVIAIELNKERVDLAKENIHRFQSGSNRIFLYKGDFLQIGKQFTGKQFDIAIACPPFKHNVDLNHIMLMYDLLRYKGMMSTLTSPFWITNNEPHQVEFRGWLSGKDYQLEVLPDNSFMERGKSVPTAILTIYKR